MKPNDSNTLYILHTNFNGSIEKITNTAGEIVDSMSYTPFGQRRSVTEWTRNDTVTHLIDRGFTGQQHLDNFALINFNGRMYDPVLAHFLSPDPYIQSPENPLNYNRYSYCLFSPLQYVDPSGEMIDWYRDLDGNIKWTDFTSKKDFENSGIQGTYLGKTYLDIENNLYYSLFGQIVSANSKNGKITQKIDDVFIKYAENKIEINSPSDPNNAEFPKQSSTNFSDIILFKDKVPTKGFFKSFTTTSENIHGPNELGKYAGIADIYFFVSEKNMNGIFVGGWDGISFITGRNRIFPTPQGIYLTFNRSNTNQNVILGLNFKTKDNLNNFKKQFFKLFPNAK